MFRCDEPMSQGSTVMCSAMQVTVVLGDLIRAIVTAECGNRVLVPYPTGDKAQHKHYFRLADTYIRNVWWCEKSLPR